MRTEHEDLGLVRDRRGPCAPRQGDLGIAIGHEVLIDGCHCRRIRLPRALGHVADHACCMPSNSAATTTNNRPCFCAMIPDPSCLLLAEKFQQRAIEVGCFFDQRNVPALVKHHQLRASNAIAQLLAAGERDQLILPSPHHQRWNMNRVQLLSLELLVLQNPPLSAGPYIHRCCASFG